MSFHNISNLFNFEKGSLQSTKCTPGNYNFITASADWKTHNTFTHDCEALVFAAAASGSLGRTHYVHGKFVASDLCFVLTPKDPKNLPIDLKFYHIIFNLLKDEIVNNTKSGTSKEAIGLSKFGKYELPYFDINHQRTVKDNFTKIEKINNSLIDELSSQSNLITQLRQSFLREAMQGKLTSEWRESLFRSHPELAKGSSKSIKLSDGTFYQPASELLKKIKAEKAKSPLERGKRGVLKELPPINPEEIPYEIPDNWVWCRLGEVGILKRGRSKHRPRNDAKLFKNGTYPFIQTGDVSKAKNTNDLIMTINGYYNDVGLKQSELQTKGTLCITIAANIAECGFLSFDACVPDSIVCFDSLSIATKKFVYYHIKLSQKELEMYAPATSQKNINLNILNTLLTPLPPLAEQKRIVSKLEQLLQLCDDLEKNINQSKEHTNLLLQTVLKEALEEKTVI